MSGPGKFKVKMPDGTFKVFQSMTALRKFKKKMGGMKKAMPKKEEMTDKGKDMEMGEMS